mmetsp:Transcript_30763/g.65396  ORF Transcript_30763/g.65396 Transcript_30763/m.65396 type:complete len:286 (+) Transcript_30763:37-894(+)
MVDSRPINPTAAASASNKTEMTTLPSGAYYPTFLEPLTKNEMALLDTYEKIKHYEKEAARLKAEEAKRRLEEANERYRAKVREREKAEGKGSDDEDDDDEDKPSKRADDHSDTNPSDDDDSDADEETAERRKKRAQEISKLRKEVNAARDAKDRKEAEKEAAKQKEEAMRRAHLGEGGASEGGGERKRSVGYDDDEDDDEDNEEDDERLPPRAAPRRTSAALNARTERPSWDTSDGPTRPHASINLRGGAMVRRVEDRERKERTKDGIILPRHTIAGRARRRSRP